MFPTRTSGLRGLIEAGADMVTVQSGASRDIASTLGAIRSAGAQSSLGLELHEPVEQAEGLFDASTECS